MNACAPSVDKPEELDDLTELAGSNAAPDDAVVVWSLDGVAASGADDIADEETEVAVWSLGDDPDDEVTEVVAAAAEVAVDDLDDEVTEVVAAAAEVDDPDDEDTAVMNRVAPPEPTAAPSAARSVSAPADPVPRHAAPTARLSSRPAPALSSVGSLRDRLPEARDPWQPPERPRSPEFQATATPQRRSIAPMIAAALVAAAALFAAVWWLVPQESELLPAVVDTEELEVNDGN